MSVKEATLFLGIMGIVYVGAAAPLIMHDWEENNNRGAAPEAVAWAAHVNDGTPSRPLRDSELEDFGPDANGGRVFGKSTSTHRLYCVEYFDGESASFVPNNAGNGFAPIAGASACDNST